MDGDDDRDKDDVRRGREWGGGGDIKYGIWDGWVFVYNDKTNPNLKSS